MSPKIKELVLGLGDTCRNPEVVEIRSFGFSHKQIESDNFKSKQNNITELLSISFPQIYHEDYQNYKRNKQCVSVFHSFLFPKQCLH